MSFAPINKSKEEPTIENNEIGEALRRALEPQSRKLENSPIQFRRIRISEEPTMPSCTGCRIPDDWRSKATPLIFNNQQPSTPLDKLSKNHSRIPRPKDPRSEIDALYKQFIEDLNS
jgi:hypothetical protein